MKSKILFIVALSSFLYCQIAKAQEGDFEPKRKFKLSEKVYFGGGLGLQFGTITQIELSPIAGYRFNNYLSAGIGARYTYYKHSFYDYQSSVYGGSIFSQCKIINNIIAHAEIESLNMERVETFSNPSGGYYTKEGRAWVQSYLVGLGLIQPIGERSAAYLLLLWNLNETYYSPYRNPIFRVGFRF